MVGRGKRAKQKKPKKRSFGSLKPTKRTRPGTEAGPAEEHAGNDDLATHAHSLPNMVRPPGSTRPQQAKGAATSASSSAHPADQQDHFSLPNGGGAAWKSTPSVFVTPGETTVIGGASRRSRGATSSTKRGRRDTVNSSSTTTTTTTTNRGKRNTSSTTSSSALTASGAPSLDNPDVRRRLLGHCKAGEHEVVKKMLVPGLMTPALGSQALRTAVDADQLETTRLLLWAGARESVSPSEVPLLWVAVQHRNLAMLRLLLDNGANVHHAIEGWQALHSACKLGVKPRKPVLSDDDDASSDYDDSDSSSDSDDDEDSDSDDSSSDSDEDSDNDFQQKKKKSKTMTSTTTTTRTKTTATTPAKKATAAASTSGKKRVVIVEHKKSTDKSRTTRRRPQQQQHQGKMKGRRKGGRREVEDDDDDDDDDELDENRCSSAWPFVEALLSAGADVNARTSSGETGLVLAARAGDALSVETLLTAGADPEAFGAMNAMHVAAMQNDVPVLRQLVNGQCFDVNARTRDKKKWTCFHLAAAGGHTSVIKYLLDEVEEADATLQSGDSQQQSPMHVAVEKAHPAVVGLLLSRKVGPDAQDADGWTPLHLACYHGRDPIVELLRMHHASLETKTSCSDRWLPLHLSTHHNRVVQMLYPRLRDRTPLTALEYEQAIDLPNAHGLTALQSAVVNSHTLAAVTLINRGANIEVRMRNTAHTLLHLAAKHGNTVIAETLILKQGVDIAPLDAASNTPLHLAVAANYAQTAVLLIRSGATIDFRALSSALNLPDMKLFFILLSHDLENLLPDALLKHPHIRSSLVASAISHGFPSLAIDIERYLIELSD